MMAIHKNLKRHICLIIFLCMLCCILISCSDGDNDDSYLVANAPSFEDIVYTQTTEPNMGTATFTGMIPGEYRIEEVSPPPFYLGTSTVHTVNIYDGSHETVTVAFENDRYSGLTLIKLDSVTGNRLQGAVSSLYRGTEIYSTAFLGDFQSNENGMVIIENLESNQWYTVVEKQAPYGYEIDPDNAVQTVFITPEALEQNLSIIFRNPPKPKLLIQKTDSAGVRSAHSPPTPTRAKC